MDKQELRRQMKALRRSILPEEKHVMDLRIREQLMGHLPAAEEAPMIFCYVSYGTEIDTCQLLEALWEGGFRVAAPRVEGNRMRFYVIERMEDLEPGCMGILEPKHLCRPVTEEETVRAISITPGLAFTKAGDRMGYGGGYYDRFFAEYPGCLRMAAAYPFQLIDEIPTEPTDIRIEILVTPDEYMDLRRI